MRSLICFTAALFVHFAPFEATVTVAFAQTSSAKSINGHEPSSSAKTRAGGSVGNTGGSVSNVGSRFFNSGDDNVVASGGGGTNPADGGVDNSTPNNSGGTLDNNPDLDSTVDGNRGSGATIGENLGYGYGYGWETDDPETRVFRDVIDYAAQLGRLDVITMLMTVVLVFVAFGGLVAFGFVRGEVYALAKREAETAAEHRFDELLAKIEGRIDNLDQRVSDLLGIAEKLSEISDKK